MPNQQMENDPVELARRWLPVVGGGVLALIVLSRRSPRGMAMIFAGGVLAAQTILKMRDENSEHDDPDPAARGEAAVSVPHKNGIRVVKAMTIGRPRAELYSFWRDFSNLPNFMTHLKSVEVTGPTTSHWTANAPAGQTAEWDAEIINEVENELIAWRSLENASVSNAGSVHFSDAPGGRGTELKVELMYDAPGGYVGSALAKVFHEEPAQQVEDDIRRLKHIMEAGEAPTTDGQSTGSRMKPGISIGPRIT